MNLSDFSFTEFTQGMILPTANGVTKQSTSQAKVKMDKFQVGSTHWFYVIYKKIFNLP